MEKLKKIFMITSLIFLIVCFGASIWLYTVLPDTVSIVIMAIFFLALIWFGFNVKNILKT